MPNGGDHPSHSGEPTVKIIMDSPEMPEATPNTKPAGILANAGVFVLLYLLFMLPTYYLPFVGSNSAILGVVAHSQGLGVNPAFWLHLGCLFMLICVAQVRGKSMGNEGLVVFPFLAAVFDLVPVLAWIPLIPTFLHLMAITQGSQKR
jgi:hypothetical protein